MNYPVTQTAIGPGRPGQAGRPPRRDRGLGPEPGRVRLERPSYLPLTAPRYGMNVTVTEGV